MNDIAPPSFGVINISIEVENKVVEELKFLFPDSTNLEWIFNVFTVQLKSRPLLAEYRVAS